MKKIFKLCAALSFTLALSGCAGTTGNSATTAQQSPETTADATTAATETLPETVAVAPAENLITLTDAANLSAITDNPLLQAIDKRNSTARTDFTGKEIDEELLQLLGWAATGRNRDDTGFVIPLAMGSDPYVSLYLAQPSGVRKFLWEDNSFETITDVDIRSQVTVSDLSETVYAIWIFVIDIDKVPNGNLPWAYHAIGTMSEHQYLVAEEFDIQARYMAAVNADAVIELLGFDAEEKLPAGVMIMSHK